MEILVDLLATLVGMLPQRDSELWGLGVRRDLGERSAEVAPGSKNHATALSCRFGAVLTCVEYSVSPVNARPPTMLPTSVGISFHRK